MKIGVIGGGQLARMLALASVPLDIKLICIEPNPNAPAKDVTDVIQTPFADHAEIAKFLQSVDCVTVETENIPYDFIHAINSKCQLRPNLQSLKIAQDRLYEKNLFTELTIPTTRYTNIASKQELDNAMQQFTLPIILKTRRSGYDGKGQAVIKNLEEANKAWETLHKEALIAEQFIQFEFEVSLLSVRDLSGNICFYPLTLNQHQAGILRLSTAPFLHPALQKKAEHYAEKILTKLDYVGVLAIEFFYDGKTLFANEMAPRVHNSGHWTIEGAETSQFENHLRAISGLPLGETNARGFSAMINCIGVLPNLKDILTIAGSHYHSYHKAPRPNRKLGHITLRADSEDELNARVTQLLEKMTIES